MSEDKIQQLPGTRISPETLLCKSMEDIEDTRDVIIITRHKDDTYSCTWSSQRLSDLSFATKMLEIALTEAICGDSA